MAWGEELSADLRTRIVDAHKNYWKRYKAIFKQFLVHVSSFLTIVKKYREFQTVDNPERWGRKQKLSSRNVRKIVWDQFQPKFKVNITFPFIKIFQVNITKDIEKKSFTGCRQRKEPFLQDMQIKAFLYFVNRQLDGM